MILGSPSSDNWPTNSLRPRAGLITTLIMHATVLWSDHSYLDMGLPMPRSTQKERAAAA